MYLFITDGGGGHAKKKIGKRGVIQFSKYTPPNPTTPLIHKKVKGPLMRHNCDEHRGAVFGKAKVMGSIPIESCHPFSS